MLIEPDSIELVEPQSSYELSSAYAHPRLRNVNDDILEQLTSTAQVEGAGEGWVVNRVRAARLDGDQFPHSR
ncbi:hypothetical protein EVAR_66349_1, partial [Eumeta japonica]